MVDYVIVAAVIAALAAVIFFARRRRKKNGGCTGCAACTAKQKPGCGNCEEADKQK